MIWPPVKAWTRKIHIDGHVHFVAINYGGELLEKWVILMSVIDSNVVIKVPWFELLDSSIWESGWDEINNKESSKQVNNKAEVCTTDLSYPSSDSGLTIPLNKNSIRPWFKKI